MTTETNAQQQDEEEEGEDEIKCKGCKELFSSRTKLFDHLKKFPKHAALLKI